MYIKLHGNERLHCARCDEDFGNQMAFLDVPKDGQVALECLCAKCDRIENDKTITVNQIDFGKMILDVFQMGVGLGKVTAEIPRL